MLSEAGELETGFFVTNGFVGEHAATNDATNKTDGFHFLTS
jgi:hypothetical protein